MFKFTIAMSVYDGVSILELKRSVSSILNQQYSNFELFIVADGVERVDLLDCISSFSHLGSNIKVLSYEENRGLAYAMNLIIKSMSGDYFVRMDADDISLPNRLSKINEYLQSNPHVDVVGSFMTEVDLNTITDYGSCNSLPQTTYPTTHDQIKRTMLWRNPLSHATTAIKKTVFDAVPGYPIFSLRNEDTLLWLSIFKSGFVFSNIPDSLYLCHYDSKVLSRRNSISKSYSDFIDRLRVIFDLNGKWYHCLFAFSLFILTLTPFYSTIRSLILRRRHE